ncbi:cyclin N-terminal domain-containing protein 1 [Pelodytes ibericus]
MDRAQFQTKVGFSTPGTVFGVASSDILEDILVYLAKENEQGLKDILEYTGCFKDQKIVELVFLLSEFWSQDSAIKYQAVEILDRFMILHVDELYNSSVEGRKITDASHAKTWNSITSSLCDMFVLHLVSCIQIASKLYFHCHIINNNTVLQFLKSAGYKYSKGDLLKSELTVLRTLHFRVNLLSPFNYIELLLEVLGHNGCSLSLDHLYGMCLMVLDLVYLLRNPIYDMLLKESIYLSTPTRLQRSKFVSVKEDQMLLATGVICVSAYIISQDSWNQVLDNLNYITGIRVNSMFEISSSILKHCVGTIDQ